MELAIVGTEQKSVHNHLRMLLDHSERSTVPKPPLPLKSGTSKVGVETHREVDLVARQGALDALSDPSCFSAIANEAAGLTEQIEESRLLSERVSRTVRQLDEAQMNVQQALALVEDVVNLKGCANGVVGALSEDDLVGATGYVRQFHDIASVAAQASEDYERMVRAERELQIKVLKRFEAACAMDLGSSECDLYSSEVAKYCALLAPLGLAEDGVKGYLAFARREIAKVIASTASVGAGGCSEEDEEGALSRLFNGAAAFLQSHVSVAAAALSRADGGAALLQLVHHDIETEAIRLLRSYMRSRDVSGHASATLKEQARRAEVCELHRTGSGGASVMLGRALSEASKGVRASKLELNGDEGFDGERHGYGGTDDTSAVAGFEGGVEALNEALDDMAIVMQHVESYDRFLRHTAQQLEEDQFKATTSSSSSSVSSLSHEAVSTGTTKSSNGGSIDEVNFGRRNGILSSNSSSMFPKRQIFPLQTKLNESVAELGGYFSVLEEVRRTDATDSWTSHRFTSLCALNDSLAHEYAHKQMTECPYARP